MKTKELIQLLIFLLAVVGLALLLTSCESRQERIKRTDSEITSQPSLTEPAEYLIERGDIMVTDEVVFYEQDVYFDDMIILSSDELKALHKLANGKEVALPIKKE